MPPLKILVAEDDRVSRDIVRAHLRRAGCDVTIAEDGQRALEILQSDRFDVALIDYNMPHYTGPEVAAAFREKEPPDQHLIMIALTASALVDDHERCRAAGMDDVTLNPSAATTSWKCWRMYS